MALRPVDEDCNRQEVVTKRALPVGEDRSRRNRKEPAAPAAFPRGPRPERVDIEATALWTIGLACIVSPADALEGGPRLVIRHARNGAQRERPCGCGEEKMRGHGSLSAIGLYRR